MNILKKCVFFFLIYLTDCPSNCLKGNCVLNSLENFDRKTKCKKCKDNFYLKENQCFGKKKV